MSATKYLEELYGEDHKARLYKGTEIVPLLNGFVEYTKLKTKNVPDFLEFKLYAISKLPSVDHDKLMLKYEAWKANGWKDGRGKPVKNWKSKLLQTLPYLKLNERQQTTSSKAKEAAGRLFN